MRALERQRFKRQRIYNGRIVDHDPAGSQHIPHRLLESAGIVSGQPELFGASKAFKERNRTSPLIEREVGVARTHG